MRYALFLGCLIPVKYPQIEVAARKTLPALGISLVDLEGFSCCPDPINFKAINPTAWLTMAARNLCLAEEAGLDILAFCDGCAASLSEAKKVLEENPKLKAEVNSRLNKIGKEYRGRVSVKHVITVLREVGERVRESIRRPLVNIRVAAHYGCHLLKPSEIMRVDDPENPIVLEELVGTLGAVPLQYDQRLLCCGGACLAKEIPLQMALDKLSSVDEMKADCVTLVCPFCFDIYDLGQIRVEQKFGKKFNIPAIYYLQLLGLAQDMKAEELGLHRHKVIASSIIEKLQ